MMSIFIRRKKEDGKLYDENGYLFEDWYSDGVDRHDGIRSRNGISWQAGWKRKENKVDVDKLINTFRDMANRESLLAYGGVSQEDLLNQIVGTIAKVAER